MLCCPGCRCKFCDALDGGSAVRAGLPMLTLVSPAQAIAYWFTDSMLTAIFRHDSVVESGATGRKPLALPDVKTPLIGLIETTADIAIASLSGNIRS